MRIDVAHAGIRARRTAALAVAAWLASSGCTRTPESTRGDGTSASARPDSIVLERTPCFGFCPAYRMTLLASGEVHFEGRPQRGLPASDTTVAFDPAGLDTLLALAQSIGFFSLPDDITPGNREACPLAATDHPGAIVTIASGDVSKRVNHYHGCHANQGMNPGDAYPDLTRFENAIDSVAGVQRWLSIAR